MGDAAGVNGEVIAVDVAEGGVVVGGQCGGGGGYIADSLLGDCAGGGDVKIATGGYIGELRCAVAGVEGDILIRECIRRQVAVGSLGNIIGDIDGDIAANSDVIEIGGAGGAGEAGITGGINQAGDLLGNCAIGIDGDVVIDGNVIKRGRASGAGEGGGEGVDGADGLLGNITAGGDIDNTGG